jgi:ABC-2 type transport system ATP-binding protein
VATLIKDDLRLNSRIAEQSVLSCEGVTYVYPDGTRANDSVDLALGLGELFCLIGPNGAGKTTLVRQITADLRPSQGRVMIGGLDAHLKPAATKRLLGVIPQTAGLFDMLTVEEHLRAFGPLKGLTRAETRREVETIVAKMAMTNIRRKRVNQLSGGERRKILVGLALLGNPPVLILDEPTVGLDPEARRALWKIIEGQRLSGKTILLTTHYMDEAERLANRIGIIVSGRLLLVGTLHELYARVGKSIRVTRVEEGSDSGKTNYYFDSLNEAHDFIGHNRFENYSVGRVSLEDLYLRLVGNTPNIGAA